MSLPTLSALSPPSRNQMIYSKILPVLSPKKTKVKSLTMEAYKKSFWKKVGKDLILGVM